jgi:D-tyrosyl-tRNA(Tyr) deacylase
MNLSLLDAGGGLLLVPQFTLAADTRHGLRPGFSTAAPPELGKALFDRAVIAARAGLGDQRVATGRFGAHMRVSLTNDGPVTFWLRTPAPARR